MAAKPGDRTLIRYRGAVTQHRLHGLGVELLAALAEIGTSDKTIRRVFSVFVELGQNIQRYSLTQNDPHGAPSGSGEILIWELDSAVRIQASNATTQTQAEDLKQQCDRINTLSPSQLKEMHIAGLRRPRRQDSRGAQVGLVEIARRSGDGIGYGIDGTDSESCIVTLTVDVPKEKQNGKLED